MSDHKVTLYEHKEHPHKVRNVNVLQALERKAGGFNQRVAVFVTNVLSNMWCAYFFVFLAILGFPGFHATANQYVQWTSQTFIQLVALSILSVGQDVLGRHQQLQAEETYQTTLKIFHENEELKKHLEAQDAEILALKNLLLVVVKKVA